MVADYAAQVDRESRFSAIMNRQKRAKEGLSCAQYRTTERGREWFRGTRSSYWWQDTGSQGATEAAR